MLAVALARKAVEPATAATTRPPPTWSRGPRRPRPRAAGRPRCASGPGLVVDELGYLPLPGEAASHLFQVVSRRYESGSIILTTNRGIAEWGDDLERDLPRIGKLLDDGVITQDDLPEDLRNDPGDYPMPVEDSGTL